jgi:hypothetical protein
MLPMVPLLLVAYERVESNSVDKGCWVADGDVLAIATAGIMVTYKQAKFGDVIITSSCQAPSTSAASRETDRESSLAARQPA